MKRMRQHTRQLMRASSTASFALPGNPKTLSGSRANRMLGDVSCMRPPIQDTMLALASYIVVSMLSEVRVPNPCQKLAGMVVGITVHLQRGMHST